MLYFKCMRNVHRFFWITFALTFIFSSFSAAKHVPGEIIVNFILGVISLPRGAKAAGVSAAMVSAASVRALNAKNGVYKVEQLYKRVLEIRPEWTDLSNYYILYFSEEADAEKV